ncbi:MAG TPA: hypothetical protein VGB37_10500 [Candidatus Lokiarchaeia archaeon]
MSKYIDDLWVLLKTGALIFHYSEKSVDPTLFGAILSALNTYSENLAEGGVSEFEFKKNRITFLKLQNIMIVALSSTQIKQKKVKNALEDIATKFFNLYSEDYIDKWHGDVKYFSEFKILLEKSFKK